MLVPAEAPVEDGLTAEGDEEDIAVVSAIAEAAAVIAIQGRQAMKLDFMLYEFVRSSRKNDNEWVVLRVVIIQT